MLFHPLLRVLGPHLQSSLGGFFSFLFLLGREDPHPMDSTWSNRLPQIHIGQRCLELWHRDVGGDVLRREALLGNDKPRCKHVQELPPDGTLRAQHSFCSQAGWGQEEESQCERGFASSCRTKIILPFDALFLAAAQNRQCAEGSVSAQRRTCFPQQTTGASLMLLELESVPLLLNDKGLPGDRCW